MSLRRLFSHHSHRGHHHPRNPNLESSEEFQRSFSANNADDTHEHQDIIPPLVVNKTVKYASEQQAYRTRRRSSVQILDKKFLPSLSNQSTGSGTTNSDGNVFRRASEDVCELFSFYYSFSLVICLCECIRRVREK